MSWTVLDTKYHLAAHDNAREMGPIPEVTLYAWIRSATIADTLTGFNIVGFSSDCSIDGSILDVNGLFENNTLV